MRLAFNPIHNIFDFVADDDDSLEAIGVLVLGMQNHSNLLFATPDLFVGGTLRLFLNGVRLHETSDYTTSESGGVGTGFDVISFVSGFAPKASDRILADYRKFV